MNDEPPFEFDMSPQPLPPNRQRNDPSRCYFEEAETAATLAGLHLRRCTEYHFQLIGPNRSWIVNIYPSTQRLHDDPKKPGPFVDFRRETRNYARWDLLDVVAGYVEHIRRNDTLP